MFCYRVLEPVDTVCSHDPTVAATWKFTFEFENLSWKYIEFIYITHAYSFIVFKFFPYYAGWSELEIWNIISPQYCGIRWKDLLKLKKEKVLIYKTTFFSYVSVSIFSLKFNIIWVKYILQIHRTIYIVLQTDPNIFKNLTIQIEDTFSPIDISAVI